MTTFRQKTSRSFAAFAALGLILPGVAAAQDDGDDEKERPGLEDIDPFNPFAERPDPHDELAELFVKVEKRLLRMGDLLLDASAGDTTALTEVGGAGIDEILANLPERPGGGGGIGDLLRASEGHGERVLEDIDRILEIAEESGGS